MTEPDKTIIDPVAKLMSYGLPEWQIKDCKKILQEALTPEDVTSRLRKDHSTCDKSQLLMPLFAPLYQNDLDIRNKVQSELATTGISSDIIDEYLLNPHGLSSLTFHLGYSHSIPLETRENFINAADQVIFNTLKSYLGLPPQELQP